MLFIDEQRLQAVERGLRQLGLEDVAVIAVGRHRRHRHHFANALHRQPAAEQADLAHQPQGRRVLLDDLQRAHRLVAPAVPAVALHGFINDQHEAGWPQRQIHRSLPCLAVDPHRLRAGAAARPVALIPQQGDLCPLPIGVHARYGSPVLQPPLFPSSSSAVAFAFIQCSELVSHPLSKHRGGCRLHPPSLQRW